MWVEKDWVFFLHCTQCSDSELTYSFYFVSVHCATVESRGNWKWRVSIANMSRLSDVSEENRVMEEKGYFIPNKWIKINETSDTNARKKNKQPCFLKVLYYQRENLHESVRGSKMYDVLKNAGCE